jgi:hypothetical protein
MLLVLLCVLFVLELAFALAVGLAGWIREEKSRVIEEARAGRGLAVEKAAQGIREGSKLRKEIGN